MHDPLTLPDEHVPVQELPAARAPFVPPVLERHDRLPAMTGLSISDED